MCEELLLLGYSVQLGLERTYTCVKKVPSPLKAPTRMYAILLFIFIPKE
jgi:hypothetical protein